jgi:selenocysteine lyase/cysteine desulfurase
MDRSAPAGKNTHRPNPIAFEPDGAAQQDSLSHSTDACQFDALRAREYARLDAQGHVYLDYTGGALYAESQVREHMALLCNGVFGNPHSDNPTSQAATELTERARAAVLRYFNAAPDEYVVIFTPNASGALKLVGEAYPFDPGDRYLLTVDNHNSVNGIREFVRSKGATSVYAPITLPDLRIDAMALQELLAQAQPCHANLFAYPAQSNFSGVQHDLEWIAIAQEQGWDVLLDAAAFVPTNRLDVRRWRPDFVALSFYKLFGYPTGVGCLIARRTSLAKLHRPWFAGGTVTAASVQGDGHFLHRDGAAFEDGTIDYLNLSAVEIGLRFIDSIGIEAIHTHVMDLTGWLLDQVPTLRHSNGAPLIRIYGPKTTDRRGSTLALNFLDRHGDLIDLQLVEQRAKQSNISLRTGCFCNPGVGEVVHGLTRADLEPCFITAPWMSREQFMEAVLGKDSGAVRISIGLPTNRADVNRFVDFARGFLD